MKRVNDAVSSIESVMFPPLALILQGGKVTVHLISGMSAHLDKAEVERLYAWLHRVMPRLK